MDVFKTDRICVHFIMYKNYFSLLYGFLNFPILYNTDIIVMIIFKTCPGLNLE